LVDGKALSKKSEHQLDTVEHRTIDNDGPGRMDVILSQSGQKA